MDFQQFKILHSETIMYYQVVEHDLKLIYAYMRKGDVGDNLDMVETKTLGQMIDMLKILDNEDGKPNISSGDYNYLKQLSKNRNHWAHKVFTEFMYEDNFMYSNEYERQCQKLQKDHDRLSVVFRNVEKVRIRLCSEVYRRYNYVFP